ncbi:DUF2231 domain-containing protein [Arthrobacter sp. UM1]|uniref:DUF2231 domain-containing protein n=1 Tax=Arthrobacter sp. UM1 TaxID=2766776 RepID=UPI001CF67B34|nr:DUF2231 domain-containing protein [Arthrobacter sp. UM1]MCB4207380.1 hypothetical protein [Arthrobacter sp. UM1]
MLAASLPLHPLFVHVPVVFIPLTLIVVLPGLFSRRWERRFGFLAVAFAVIAAVSAWLATFTGEDLLHRVGSSGLVDKHRELGETARNLAFALAAFVTARWFAVSESSPARIRGLVERRPWIETLLAAATSLCAVAATVWAVLAGHSGAVAVWNG